MTRKSEKDLFDSGADNEFSPLAERMRPRSLAEFVGQKHLVGEKRLLARVSETGKVPSLILWGPPGSGKTTLARLLAGMTSSEFVSFSAVLSGVKEVRDVVEEAGRRRKMEGKGTLLFVDEIHRFNKAQQDAFLPHVETGTIVLVGATTENPSFEVIPPLLSRCQVIKLDPLSDEDVGRIIDRAMNDAEHGLGARKQKLADDARALTIEAAHGDARKALNAIEIAASFTPDEGTISPESVMEAIKSPYLRHDRAGEDHYNVISAFIKSLRGSDPDAALYWLARLVEAGEDPRFIARRMIILASEDIGNAEPAALMVAIAVAQAVEHVGMPEAAINLAHGVTYLACAPKSNASYMGLHRAVEEVRKSGALDVPLHLRNAPTKLMSQFGYGKDYKYAHDFEGGYVEQQYLPDELVGKQFYRPTYHGKEKNIAEKLEKLRQQTPENKSDKARRKKGNTD